MEMISNPTSVTFAPLPDENNDGIADYLTFRRGSVSAAYVGWNPDGQRMVNLTKSGSNNKGTVAHELMHILGFEHAHQHPDSVSLIEHNPGGDPMNYGINFDGTIIGPYDPNSIMHYGLDEGFTPGIDLKPGAVIPDGVNIGKEDHLSQGDIDSINKIYHIDEDRIIEGFDPKFYLEQYPDVADVYGQNNHQGAYIHWYQYGMREGKMPSLAFDPLYYLQTLPQWIDPGAAELKTVEILHQQAQSGNYAGLYMHWINNLYGLFNGYSGSIHFDPGYYLNKYFSRQSLEFDDYYTGRTYSSKAVAHWLRIGKNEGKFGTLAEEQSHQTQ